IRDFHVTGVQTCALPIYLSAISRLLETRALLAGYTDRPRSRYVVGLLHLLSLEPENVNRTTLATDGRLEGLEDKALFHYLLRPRSEERRVGQEWKAGWLT